MNPRLRMSIKFDDDMFDMALSGQKRRCIEKEKENMKKLCVFFQQYHRYFRMPLFTRMHYIKQVQRERYQKPFPEYAYVLAHQIANLWWRSIELDISCIDIITFRSLMEHSTETRLERIVLHSTSGCYDRLLECIPNLAKTLKHLTVGEVDTPRDLRWFLSSFPNLETLQLSYDNRKSSDEWTGLASLTQLESLTICNGFVTRELADVVFLCQKTLRTLRLVDPVYAAPEVLKPLKAVPSLTVFIERGIIETKDVTFRNNCWLEDPNAAWQQCVEDQTLFEWQRVCILTAAFRACDPDIASSILNFFQKPNDPRARPTELEYMLMNLRV